MSELVQIKGVTPALLEGSEGRRGLLDLVTVWGGGNTANYANVNTVGPEVLRAYGVSEAEVSELQQRRRESPLFVPDGRFSGRISQALTSTTFRIEAVGMVEGQVRARVTAIVQEGAGDLRSGAHDPRVVRRTLRVEDFLQSSEGYRLISCHEVEPV